MTKKMETELWLTFILFSFYIQWVDGFNSDSNPLIATTEMNAVATTQSYRLSRAYRRGNHDNNDDDDDDNDDDDDDVEDTKALSEAKNEYWGGYYDFLINEGSYKFWAVFQLATAALLIYSGFAALYYAKVNPSTTDDYEDYFLRRKRRDVNSSIIFDMATFQRIIDAIERQN